MIPTSIFWFLFVFTKIESGLSTDPIVYNMNNLFRQQYWKETIGCTRRVKDKNQNVVTLYEETIDYESGKQYVTEENVNDKVRVAYLIMHHYYSITVRDIVDTMRYMIEVDRVPLSVLKQCVDKFETSFSKIKSSLALLYSYYQGHDLPTVVQDSVKSLEKLTNKAYAEAWQWIYAGQEDPMPIRINFVQVIGKVFEPLDKLHIDCENVDTQYNHNKDDLKAEIEEYFYKHIYFNGIDMSSFVPQWYFLAFQEYDINKVYDNFGFEYDEQTKGSSIRTDLVEPISLFQIDFTKLNL